MGLYTPSLRELTSEFAKDILAGRKFLLKQNEVMRVGQIPNFKEFSTKRIWNSVNDDPLIKLYFPSYAKNIYPSNFFLFYKI